MALLAIPALEPRGPLSTAGFAVLRSTRDLSGFLLRLGLWVALEGARIAPLGFLAVMALPDRPRRRERIALVALPATVLALAGALLALGIAGRPSPFAGLAALRLPIAGAGVAVGVGAALAWRRGSRARLLFVPRLMAAAGSLVLLGGLLAWLAIEREPRTAPPRPISSAEKLRLYDLFRGKNPREVPAGETRTVRLSADDVERLSAWASAAVRRGHGVARLDGPGLASADASLQLPWPRDRWLNVAARATVGIADGRLDLTVHALRVGRVGVPRWLLAALSPVVVRVALSEPYVRGALSATRALRIEPDAVTATYGRLETPRGTIARLMWGGALDEVRARVRAYVARLLEVLPGAPSGDRRFVTALGTAFAQARERSRGGSAVEENRAALVALGIVLGHPKLSAFIGDPLDAETAGRLRAIREATLVRGRPDWVRHFAVSGALVVLSSAAPSDAAGLFKEERDAAGGSGFSFGDLLADRAGTIFADLATRDEDSATGIQERLARGASVEDLFPPAADLPEGIQDEELERRYGGVGGPLYRQYAEEIERRVAACPAYRP